MPVSTNRSFAQLAKCARSKALVAEQQRVEAGTAQAGLLSVARNTYPMRHVDAQKGVCICTSACNGCYSCTDKGPGAACGCA